jgi:hypothetical protein
MALENIPSITGADDIADPDKNLMPVFQVQSQDPGLATGELQKLYGTAAMPMFQWAKRIQSGEATFDPSNQFDREAADFIGSASDQELAAQGLDISVKDVIAQSAGLAGGAVISSAGAMAAQAGEQLGQAVGSADFFRSLGPAAKSYLPGSAGGFNFGADAAALGGANVGTNLQAASALGLAPNQTAVTASVANTLNSSGVSKTLGLQSTPDPNIFKVDSGAFNQFNTQAAVQGTDQVGSIVSGADAGMFEPGGFFDAGTTGYMPSIGQIGANALLTFGLGMLQGQSPVQALKNTAITTAGTVVGTAIGGPIGGFIGGTIASVVGGRVICNELARQGFMDRNQIILDYKFTREHLSPQHVKGYHAWAVHVVRRLRKGKGVNFWRHIATHRVNEIAYIYGERDKPDYLGKFYRHFGEKGCWLVGLFCEKSDWSALYKIKEA